MFSFLAHLLSLLMNQRSIETTCHHHLFWATLITTSRRSLVRSRRVPRFFYICSLNALASSLPVSSTSAQAMSPSIWFPEGVPNQTELAASNHSNCNSEFVVTEKNCWCIKHVSRRKILSQRKLVPLCMLFFSEQNPDFMDRNVEPLTFC